MKLYGITCCINYADFLVWSLPSAKHVFDKLIVVTSKADSDTKRVCDSNYVECIQTDIGLKDGVFNKGLMINFGLEYLNPPDWIIHFDSDCVFPARSSEFIRSKKLNVDVLYGVDRVLIKSWDEWINFYTNPFPQSFIGSVWPGFELGYRVIQNGGYSPVGFCQIFNARSKFLKRPLYPIEYNDASESDLALCTQYPPENRQLIPELFLYHLESENSEIGVNWNGRKTKRFGPQ